jgi:hypothetical protein
MDGVSIKFFIQNITRPNKPLLKAPLSLTVVLIHFSFQSMLTWFVHLVDTGLHKTTYKPNQTKDLTTPYYRDQIKKNAIFVLM